MREALREIRRAKIVATLGPSSDSAEAIAALIAAGMDVARINFSHGEHAEHAERIARLRSAAAARGRHVGILQDLQGPKLRVGRFPNGSRRLETGTEIVLTARPANAPPDAIEVTYERLHQDLRADDDILLDDGNLALKVIRIDGVAVHCRVITGGDLKDRKGVNIPGRTLSLPALTEKDRRDLLFGLEAGVDWVALSFVQRPEDIADVRAVMADAGIERPVLAKIEKPQALAHLGEIIAAADGLMVARGDLGVEIPAEDVPHWQKHIIEQCNHAGKPVVTATQMLDSMIVNPRPTRAEASDVANAVLDGSDALMLSGETAAGAYPVAAVETMARIILRAESQDVDKTKRRRAGRERHDPATATGFAACQAATLVHAAAVVSLTQTGSSARELARHRPDIPIVAVTADTATCNQLSIVWGVTPLYVDALGDSLEAAVDRMMSWLGARLDLTVGQPVVFTAGLPFEERRPTNTIRVEVMPDPGA